MRKILTLLLLVLPIVGQAQKKPKLVVNVVVSGVSWNLLQRFGPNLSDEGFARFASEGMTFDAAYYSYMQTNTPTGLATLTTGAEPSMHGVVAPAWIEYVTNGRVDLTADPSEQGLGTGAGEGAHSPLHLVMPTLGDRLLDHSPGSKVISVAGDPISAVVAGGQRGRAYWMEAGRATWHTSTYYADRLPAWIVAYNTDREASKYREEGWSMARPKGQYINKSNTIFAGGTGKKIGKFDNYNALTHSPFGNTLMVDFATRLVAEEKLGQDDATDILTICFDPTRWVGETYGAASMEVEDMVYRLDIDLGRLAKAILAKVQLSDVLFVVTADHGLGEGIRDRFNVAQFRTILNSFLGAQFGVGEWVIDCIDREIYLNRNLVYQKGLNLSDVQTRAATFALQFRGVSHVLTATALSGGYFGEGWGRQMQCSFYPRRGGDVVLNLMPGWVEEREGTKSLSGSMYDYDTHVPLMFWGWQIPAIHITEPVDMVQVAPTIAYLIGVTLPMMDNDKLSLEYGN